MEDSNQLDRVLLGAPKIAEALTEILSKPVSGDLQRIARSFDAECGGGRPHCGD
jgi:hypothetical protein